MILQNEVSHECLVALVTFPTCLTCRPSVKAGKGLTEITLVWMKRSEVPPECRLRCQSQPFCSAILNRAVERSIVAIHMILTRLRGLEAFVKEEAEYFWTSKDKLSIHAEIHIFGRAQFFE